MRRTFRLAVPLGVFLLAGVVFPSSADAQRRGGGGGGGSARGTAVARGGGPAVRGGGIYGRPNVAVPRTRPPYYNYRPHYNYRPYYSHAYYRPYYAGYYPRYYSPWSWSLSFGFGWYGGAYAPFYGYPYYSYVTPYSAYSYPYPDAPTPAYAAPAPSPPQYQPPASGSGYNNEFGTLSLRVQPSDATILIDQQVWDRPRGDDRFSLEVVEGPHHVEIRKSGYTSYVRTIDVPRGRSVVLNVALTQGGTRTIQVARTVPFR